MRPSPRQLGPPNPGHLAAPDPQDCAVDPEWVQALLHEVLHSARRAGGGVVTRHTGRTAGRPHRAALSVAYQVMIDLDTRGLRGVEALARLVDDQQRAVSPEVFIPIAEHTGLIAALDRRVLAIACADLARWHTRHPRWAHLGVSVNVSAHPGGELPGLVTDVQHSLVETGLDARSLTLELTETAALSSSHPAVTVLHELRGMGVHLSLDDFGTGYASLRHLALLPMSGLKIDRSFIAGLPHDPTAVAIVAAVTTLARDLHLTCVAEGIETSRQLTALPAGVIGQGFLLGRPSTAAQIDTCLAAYLAASPTV